MSHPANDIYLEQRRELKEEILAMRIYKDFEDFLMQKHGEQYNGLDDEMPDDYEKWLQDLDVNDLIKYGNQYAKVCNPF